MIKGFKKRKIDSNKTLGELLHHKRMEQNLSISEAETGTKVRGKFLLDLEKGDWSNLPVTVYVRGFVLAYAKYLGIKKGEALELFEAEANFRRGQSKDHTLSYKKTINETRVLITPKFLGYAALSFFIVALFSYIVYQISNFAGSPTLRLVSPNNNAVVDNDMISIKGITETDIFLAVNGENVPVTNDGHFDATLRLHQGVNVIKVQATSKVKKESVEVLTVEYKPKTAKANDTIVNQ